MVLFGKQSSHSLTHQSRSIDHREVVAINERRPQGTEKGCPQQTGCDWLLKGEGAHVAHRLLSSKQV